MAIIKHERRSSESEIRNEGRVISGYAAKWNSQSQLLTGPRGEEFYEILKPYCFDLENSPSVLLNYEHEDSDVLDRSDGGTLELRQDDIGLAFRSTLPEQSPKINVSGLIEQIQRKVLRGMSFAFDVIDGGESWSRATDGKNLRTITKAVLFDVCVTPCPAYLDTEVAVRSLGQMAARASRLESQRRFNYEVRKASLRVANEKLRR
jgi:hypothetical protein